MNRFTARAQRLVVEAENEAKRLGATVVGTEHLFLALLPQEEAPGIKELRTCNVDTSRLTAVVEKLVGQGTAQAPVEYPFTEAAKLVLIRLADEEARRLGHKYIGTEHLLLSLLREKGGIVEQSLQELGHDPYVLRNKIRLSLGGGFAGS